MAVTATLAISRGLSLSLMEALQLGGIARLVLAMVMLMQLAMMMSPLLKPRNCAGQTESACALGMNSR
jgi:hypothetical protein